MIEVDCKSLSRPTTTISAFTNTPLVVNLLIDFEPEPIQYIPSIQSTHSQPLVIPRRLWGDMLQSSSLLLWFSSSFASLLTLDLKTHHLWKDKRLNELMSVGMLNWWCLDLAWLTLLLLERKEREEEGWTKILSATVELVSLSLPLLFSLSPLNLLQLTFEMIWKAIYLRRKSEVRVLAATSMLRHSERCGTWRCSRDILVWL